MGAVPLTADETRKTCRIQRTTQLVSRGNFVPLGPWSNNDAPAMNSKQESKPFIPKLYWYVFHRWQKWYLKRFSADPSRAADFANELFGPSHASPIG